MSSLQDMIDLLENTERSLDGIITWLDKIQTGFNNNFSNLNRVRRKEISFLQKLFMDGHKDFPKKFVEDYKKEIIAQETAFNDNMTKLQKKKSSLKKELEEINKKRKDFYMKLKKKNVKLDKNEEKLKERIKKLEVKIDKYNNKIDELSSGFGFVINFLKMKEIEDKKEEIQTLRDETSEAVEYLRKEWEDTSSSHKDEERTFREKWNDVQTQYSILMEKLKTLSGNREEIIRKAAFLKTLEGIEGSESYIKDKSKNVEVTCKNCKSINRETIYFCKFCGERLQEDRDNIEGSLKEISEINAIYESLTEGLKGSVSFLAMMKGLKEGVKKFITSVQSVKDSQDRYSSLSKLSILIPKFSEEFSAGIKDFEKNSSEKDYLLHPNEFAASVLAYTEKELTDDRIEKFFKEMGNELKKSTEEQW